jgi:hypothetical protein
MIDSKVIEKDVYSSGIKIDEESEWIQPSITSDMIMPGNSVLIDGIYVRTLSETKIVIFDKELAQEIDAWESASDFDYWSFEKSLGE